MKALQPDIVPVVKEKEIEEPLPQKNHRERRDKRKFEKDEHEREEELEPTEPEVTAMELAWRLPKIKPTIKDHLNQKPENPDW